MTYLIGENGVGEALVDGEVGGVLGAREADERGDRGGRGEGPAVEGAHSRRLKKERLHQREGSEMR